MALLQAYKRLQASQPKSETEAQEFLASLDEETQEQIIAAIYLGREHIHSTELRENLEINRSYTDHIPQEDYARIIYEKGGNIELYLNKLEECARESGFDLESI